MICPDVNVLVAALRSDHVHHVMARAALDHVRDDGAAIGLPDALLAATAIEYRAELVSFDRGFARYAGLRWRTPT